MTKKVILIHGWGGNPKDNWIPWLAKELKQKGFQVITPLMKDSNNPKIKEWVEELSNDVSKLDENTYFVGHSIGCQTIMRYLEAQKENKKIGGILFVAGWFHLLETSYEEPEEEKKIAEPWLTTPIRFDKIKNISKKIVAIFSDDDPCVPISDSEIFKKELDAKIIIEKNQKHFTNLKYPLILKEVMELTK